MIFRQPPVLATRLLDRLGYTRQNGALTGDLLEEFRDGRSAGWYWRQTFGVIWTGAARNVVASQAYWIARGIGFGAQILIAFSWFRWPTVGVALMAILQLSGVIWIMRARWRMGAAFRKLRRFASTPRSSARSRFPVLALASIDTFISYLGGFILCTVVLPHISLVEAMGLEISWFGVWTLAPGILQAPSGAAVNLGQIQDLCLSVALSDGRAVVLRQDNVVESAFQSADPELIAALFQHGASAEVLRRAIWLGCLRRSPEITVARLDKLVAKVASMKAVEKGLYRTPPASFWRRVLRALWE